MKKAVLVSVVILGLVFISGAFAAEVQTGVLCTGIVDKACEGAGTAFPADVGKVYAHTRIVGMDSGGSVVHRWIYKDKTMAEVTLDVGGPDWRTWSSKTIDPLWTGQWKVQIIDASDGSVMETLEFTLGE